MLRINAAIAANDYGSDVEKWAFIPIITTLAAGHYPEVWNIISDEKLRNSALK